MHTFTCTTTFKNKVAAFTKRFNVLMTLLAVAFSLISVGVNGQASSANYTFATTTSGSLVLDANGNAISMASGTTDLLTTTSSDQGVSAVTNIGFDFYFGGGYYTQFAASANGVIQLGATAPAAATYVASDGTAASPRISAFCGDLGTGTSGFIKSKVVGTAPNRCLVVEFNNMTLMWTSNYTNDGTYQVRLYESGKVEFVYGTMFCTSITGSFVGDITPGIGFSWGSAANTFAYVTSASNTATTTGTFTDNPSPTAGASIPNLNSAADGSRRTYSFTPPAAPTAPSGLNFTGVTGSGLTLNWTDNSSNETGFLVFRSTDNVNFTLLTTTAANATSYAQTGLAFGTTYYYRVAAIKEIASAATSGSQATSVGTLSGTRTVGAGGNYNNLTLAFADINTNGLSGNLELQLIAGYPAAAETYPIVGSTASAAGSFNIKLYPTVSGLSITSSNATGTLNLSNTKNLFIDGRVNATAGPNDLIISNSNAGASYAIQLINDASNNTIQYCNIRSKNTSTSSGTIVFSTTTGTNGNDNNSITFCNISDETTPTAGTPANGIYASGSTGTTAQYNDNNIISNNNIYNFFSAGSATNGIFVSTGNNAWTISDNSLYQTANRTYTSANTHTGINISSSTAGNSFTVTGNFIGGTAANAGGTAYTMLGTVANLFRGITINVASTTASSVQGNTVSNIAFTTSSTTSTLPGYFSGINISAGLVNVGTTTANTIGATTGNNAIVITSTGSGGYVTGIYGTSSAVLAIQNNNIGSIRTASAAAIGHTIYGINTAGSGNHIISGNNIGSASTANSISSGLTGTTTASCEVDGIVAAGSATTLTISSNNIRNLTAATTGSTTIQGIYSSGSPTNLVMNSNTITDLKSTGASGTTYVMRAGTTIYSLNNNTISNISFTSNSGSSSSNIYGFYDLSSPTAETITNMQISGLSIAGASTSTSALIAGIYTNTSTGTKTWNNNIISNFTYTNSSTGSAKLYGIFTAASSPTIFKNKIFGLTATNGAASAVYGIYVSSGTTISVYNNLVGNLAASASGLAAPAPSVAGLYIEAGTTVNAYYNTIRITGSSSAVGFSSAAIYAATASALTLRNNIFVNTATPGSSGKTVAYQRSSSTLTSYAAASNNNLYYAGTPGANNLIFSDGTNFDQTLTAFKTRVSTRDQASVTENPTFLSNTGTDAGYLHLDPAVATQAESGGAAISGITDDYDGEVRNAGTPDIGADEFTGIAADQIPPSISSITLTGSQCSITGRTVTAIITDASGVNNSTFLPRIYYRVNAGAYTSAAGSLTSGTATNGTWTFNMTFSAAAGNVIDYFIVAQDVPGNVGGSPSTGLVLTDVNTVTTPPTTPLTYTIASTLSGTYTVGTGQNFGTLTAAIAAYNNGCLSGPVVFSLTDASYTEGAALVINANSDASATNTLTIKPTQAATTLAISGGSSTAVITLNGADYVTIDGSIGSTVNAVCPLATASRNLTITNTSTGTSSAVIWIQTTAGNNAATNNRVMNCNLVGNSNTTTLFGIGSGSTSISTSTLGTGNNNNSIINNNISKTQYGIFCQGASAANKNTGTVISQNLMNTASPNNVQRSGIYVGFDDGAVISGNAIDGLSSSSDAWGISTGVTSWVATTTAGNEVSNATISNNIVGAVVVSGANSASGIITGPAAAGTIRISNNMVYGTNSNATIGDITTGIFVIAGAGSTQVYYNTVSLSGDRGFGTTGSSLALGVAGTNPTIDIRNNILINKQTTVGAGKSYAIGLGYTGFSNLTSNNNDLFSTGVTGVTSTINTGTDAATLANWQTATGKDAASVSVDPSFVSATNLRLTPFNASLNNIGAPVVVTTDIDCAGRNGSTPDIGVNEFTPINPPLVNSVSASPSTTQCVATARTITANVTAGTNNITTVTLNYAFNGVAQTAITMTGGNANAGQTSNWTGTIPVAVPGNATVTWSVSAADGISPVATLAGPSYRDEPTTGATASIAASINPVCASSPTVLTLTLNGVAKINSAYANSFETGITGFVSGSVSGTTSLTQNSTYASDGTKSLYLNTASTSADVNASSAANIDLSGVSSAALTFSHIAVMEGPTTSYDYGYVQYSSDGGTTWNSFPTASYAGSGTIFNSVVSFSTKSYADWITNFTGTSSVPANSLWKSETINIPAAALTSQFKIRFRYTTDGSTNYYGWLIDNVKILTAPNPTAYSWSDGTNTVGTTNPVTVIPTGTTTYTASATVYGCNITSTPITINTLAIPAAPGGNNSTQCGTGVPGAFVTSGGGGGGFKWYSAQTGGTLMQTGGALYTSSITATTHFWVSESDGTCESLRTEVVAFVNPADPISATANNTNPCLNVPITLTAANTATTPVNNYTYTWSASPQAGSGLGAGQTPGTSLTVTPTATGTYVYTVTATAGDCVNTATVSVTVKALPQILTTTATPATVCEGAPVQLAATSGSVGNGNITIGAGAITVSGTTTGNGNPYNHYYGGNKTQIIYTKAELNAAGITGGNISALTTYLSALNTTTLTMNGFTINMGHTTQSAATTTLITTGLTQVYSNASQGVVVGANTYTFSTPFNWNNTDNIVVSICWSNNNSGSSGSSPTLVADVASFTAVSYIWADATTVASLFAASTTSSSGVGTTNTSNTTTNRPKVMFTATTGVNTTASLNWVWNPGAVAGSTVTVNPTTTTTYTVTATDPATTCSAQANVLVTVNPLPPAPSGNNGTDQCGTGLTDASVSSNSGASAPVFKWYLVATGGTAVQTGTSTTYQTPISETTTFYVSEISEFGCEGPRAEFTTIVSEPDEITVTASNVSICAGTTTDISSSYTPLFNNFATFELTATGGAASGVDGTVSLTANGTGTDPYTVTPTAAGTYVYSITAFDPDKGCTSVGTVAVTVQSPPAVTTATATPSTVCAGSPVTLAASIIGGSGSASIGAGATSLTAYNAPFYSAWSNKHMQILYTAADLTAGGLVAGKITTIGFPTTSGTVSNKNYSLKMGLTTATDLGTAFVTSGLTTVYTSAALNQTANTNNTITLATPFIWNGTSNLVLEICFGDPTTTTTLSSASPGDNTSYVSVREEHDFSAADGASVCASVSIDITNTYSARPKVIFGYLQDNTSQYNWVWNPGNVSAGTTGTATVNPTTTTAYTATATSIATGCSINSAPVTVTVNPLPAAPTASNSTQCGVGVPTASVSGGGTYTWYSAQTGGTVLQAGGSTYTSSISATTIFWVSSNNGTCESLRTQVTATVTPADPITATSSAVGGNTCLNTAIQLTATNTASAPTNNYTYTWTASPAAGSGIPTSTTGSPVSITPTATGTYTYTVTAFDATLGCTNIATVTVTVNAVPVAPTVSASPATICAGQTATLTAVNSPATATIGTQTTTISGDNGNPYRSGNGVGNQIKTQLLVKASELTAAGFVSGNFTSLGFTTTGIGGTVSDFVIKMANTSATALVSTFETPVFTTVFTQASFTTVLGLNTHTFSTPFFWDGTSNVLVEICQQNAIDGTNTVAAFTPGFNANNQLAGTTTSCTGTSGAVVTARPIMTFGSAGYTYTWNPGALSGSTVTVTPSTTTVYTATATIPSTGCSINSAPVTVTVNPLPAAPIGTNSVQCGLGVPTASVSTGGANGTFIWYSAQTGGTVLQTGGSTYTTAINATTHFWVAESNGTCESLRTEVVATVTSPDPVLATSNLNSVCPGTAIQLTATNSAASPVNVYSYTWTASPVSGSGIPTSVTGSPVTITPTAGGTYTYTVTATDASTNCTTVATVNVTVNPNPVITSVTATPAVVCPGGTATLNGSIIDAAAGSATLSTSTTTISSALNSTFYTAWSNKHIQIMIKAAELTAAGVQAGNITSLGFPTTSGTIAMKDFSLKLAQTSATDMSAFLTTGFTEVYTNASQPQTANTNNIITLASPYNWNGTSNLVIDICFGNSGSTTTLSSTAAGRYSTSYTSVIATYTSAATAATAACANNTSNLATFSVRPTIIVGAQVGTNVTANYNWVWNPGAIPGSTVTVTPAVTTNYTATVTNPGTGCSTTSAPVTVTVSPATAAATASPSTPVCAGTAVILNANPGGAAATSFSWSDGTAVVGTTNPLTVNPLVTTTYTVTVKDACNNSTTSSVTVTVNPLPTASIAEGPGPLNICSPSTQTLTAVTNAASASYQWTLNGSNITVGGTNPTYVVSGLGSGTYRVIVTNTATNCVSAVSAGVVVTINAQPSVPTITPAAATVCAGTPQSLTVSGGTVGASGTLAIGAGATTITGTTTGYGNIYNHWYGGQKTQFIYRKSELNAAGITSAAAISAIAFQISALGSSTLTMNNFTISVGHTTQTAAANPLITTGLTQVYSNTAQTVVSGLNSYTFSAPFNWNNLDNIVISVCWSNVNSGNTAASATIVGDNASFTSTSLIMADATSAANLLAASSNLSSGVGSTSRTETTTQRPKVTFTYSSTANPTYSWSPATGLNTTTGATVIATPNTTTTYTATATSPVGCTNTANVVITVNPRPTAVLSGGATYCDGQGSTSTQLSIAVTGAGPWSGTLSGGIPFSGSASPILVTVTPTTTTTYTLATLNGSLCTSTAADLSGSATVTINPTPATPTISAGGPLTFCAGGSVVLTSSSATGNQWNLNGAPLTGATNQALTVSASGDYTVTVTNGSNCSATSAITTVTVNALPATPTISAGGPTTFCEGGSVVLTSSSATGNQWNQNGSPLPGATNQSLTVTTSGNYTVTVTNANNCSATSAITTVTVNPLAVNPTATVTQPTCTVATGSVTVTAPLGAGNSYTLDGTQTIVWPAVTFTGVVPGTHILTVANSFGCSSPASTTVTVDPQPFTPSAPTVTGIVNICPYINSGTALTYKASAPGATTYTWTLPPNVTLVAGGNGTDSVRLLFNTPFTALQPNKQIRVTAGSICGTSAQTIYYLEAKVPVAPLSINGPTNVCNFIGTSTPVSYSISPTLSALGYSWSVTGNVTVSHPNPAGVNDTIINVVFNTGFNGGDVAVAATNECGASGLRTLHINFAPAATPGLINGPTNVCAHIAPTGTAATYSIAPVATATSYTWTAPAGTTVMHPNGPGANDYTITVLYPAGFTSGTISVTATNGCGTSASPRTLSVTKLSPATPSNIDVIQTHFCGEAGFTRTFTYTVAAMPAGATSVQWTVPTTAGAVLVSGQGTTSITVTYPDAAVVGTVTAQAVNACAVSSTRSVPVKLPACPPPAFARTNATTANPKLPVASESFEVKVFPNPTVSDFKLEVLTSGKEEIVVKVIDNLGRFYKTFKVMPYQTIALGSELKPGSYLIEVRQGSIVKTTKVIKF